MLQKKRPASDSRYNIGRASAPTSDSRLTWTYFTSRPHNQQASGHCPHLPPRTSQFSILSPRLFSSDNSGSAFYSQCGSARACQPWGWRRSLGEQSGQTMKETPLRASGYDLFCHSELELGTKALTLLHTAANAYAATGERRR